MLRITPLFLFFISIFVFYGCALDPYPKLRVLEVAGKELWPANRYPTELGEGEFGPAISVFWTQSNTLTLVQVFDYTEPAAYLPSRTEYDIQVYDTASYTPLATLRLEGRDEQGCTPEFRSFTALPNGYLGFSKRCHNEENSKPDVHHIAGWDLESSLEERLLSIEKIIPTDIAFHPDMQYALLENAGDGIFNQLFFADIATGTVVPFAANSDRAGVPDWSAHGIIFGATNLGGQERHSPPAGRSALGSAMFEPWDIYFMADIDAEPELWLRGVQTLDSLTWVPNRSDVVLFRGQIDSRLGLWVYDHEAQMTAFVWPENPSGGSKQVFTVSPDGENLVLLEQSIEAGELVVSPIFIDLGEVLASIRGEEDVVEAKRPWFGTN